MHSRTPWIALTLTLVAILTYHVVPGKILSDQVRPGPAATLQGASVTFSQNHGNLMIDQATIVDTDIVTTNGVIHVIDEVIMPPQPRTAGPAEELIRLAIMRGAPLFNDDQPAACAAVYEVAARGLLGVDDYGLDGHARTRLERALNDIERTHDARRQAWIMRDALDDVLAALVDTSDRMPTMSRR